MNPFLRKYLPAIILFLICIEAAGAISPDYTNMGRLLVVNRQSIQFIDTCISNLKNPVDPARPEGFRADVENLFLKALKSDFFANIWYLQGDYSRTYRELRNSQDSLQEIYRKILENYIDETWILLEASAPLIVRTRDNEARHLLQLGYRDLESARMFHQSGNNIRPTLHNNQIQYYADGIKRIRRGRRYAILSLIEARLPREEKPEFQVVTLDDVRTASENEDLRQTDYERVLNLMINMIGRQLIPSQVSSGSRGRQITVILLEVHQDNYNRLISDRRSVWQRMAAELKTDEMHARDVLPNRNSSNRGTVSAEESDPEEIKPPTTNEKPNPSNPGSTTNPPGSQPGIPGTKPEASPSPRTNPPGSTSPPGNVPATNPAQ